MWLLPECVQFGCCRPRLSDEADGGLVVQGLMHVTRAPFPYLVRGRGPGKARTMVTQIGVRPECAQWAGRS